MIHSFSANNILTPINFLTFKGVDYEELMDLIQLNQSLPPEQRKFVKLEIDDIPHVAYATLPQEYLKRYLLPEPGNLRGELELYFKCSVESRVGNAKDSRYQLFTEKIVQAYKYAWPSYAEDYFEYTYKEHKVELYAKREAVFQACHSLHYNYGFEIKQIYQSFLPFAKLYTKRISLDRFYKILEKMSIIKEDETEKVSAFLVHKSLGREKEDPKFTADAKEIAFDEYTFRNYKLVDVLETVNDFLDEQECEKIEITTLQRYFAKPAIKNLVFLKRNEGDIDTTTGFFPYLDRLRCSKRNMQWQMDADKMPIAGHDGTRTLKPKYFVCVDNKSSDTLGYSYCEAENGTSAVECLRMAIYRTKCIPYELLTDNGPGFNCDEFLTVVAQLKFYGMRHRFAKLQNADDKCVVEVGFRDNHVSWRTVSGYTGHRVVARKRDSRPTKSYKKIASHPEYVRDTAGLMALLPEVMEQQRNHRFSGKPSTKELYETSESPIDRELEPWKIAKVFWKCDEMEVKGNRIEFRYKGLPYRARVSDAVPGLNLNGERVLGRFDQNEPTRLMIFDKRTDSFITELRCHDPIHTLEEDMTEYDHSEFANYNQKVMKMKKDINNMLGDRKKAVREVIKRTGYRKKSKRVKIVPESEDAMNDYYETNQLLDRPVKEIRTIAVTELDKAGLAGPPRKNRNKKKIKAIEVIESV
jgi:hypothetical protein